MIHLLNKITYLSKNCLRRHFLICHIDLFDMLAVCWLGPVVNRVSVTLSGRMPYLTTISLLTSCLESTNMAFESTSLVYPRYSCFLCPQNCPLAHTWWPGRPRIIPGLGHTSDSKRGSYSYLAWHSALKRSAMTCRPVAVLW